MSSEFFCHSEVAVAEATEESLLSIREIFHPDTSGFRMTRRIRFLVPIPDLVGTKKKSGLEMTLNHMFCVNKVWCLVGVCPVL